MLRTLKTLVAGTSARSEERVRDAYAIELIDQKIREAENGLKAAKATLATLIQRRRSEAKFAENLNSRTEDLMTRAKQALDDGNEALATEAAQAVATMENELETRTATVARLDEKIMRLQSSVDAGHRRIVDLKQGAISARAVRAEQNVQKRLASATASTSVEEAEELIGQVLDAPDPFERAEILSDINSGLNQTDIATRMGAAGYGDRTSTSAQDVLARLKSK